MVTLTLAIWCLTVLVPIHGAFYLGRRKERERIRKLVFSYWTLRNKRQ